MSIILVLLARRFVWRRSLLLWFAIILFLAKTAREKRERLAGRKKVKSEKAKGKIGVYRAGGSDWCTFGYAPFDKLRVNYQASR